MTERIKFPNKRVLEIDRMYSLALDEGDLKVAEIPEDWLAPYEHLLRFVELEAQPWQVDECRRLWNVHGPHSFDGLDLFGIVEQTPR